ncbi:MAG: HDOD domain-containing protein [Opitutae bacterium]|nr:HDOD domain-containing protein [Opitutae bacterium]
MAVVALAREKILNTARTLPAAPQVLAQLGEMLQNVNTGLDEIAELLKRDAALVARIIRISNSPYFGGDGSIGAIEEAVNRVGFGEVYRLVGMATTSRLIDRALTYYRVDAEALREHMLFTAIASEALAEETGMDARNSYTAGLLRPLGMLVLDRVARERLPERESYDHVTYGGYAKWEGQVFSVGNGEVASMILTDWRFPDEIANGIRVHYLQRDTDYGNRIACLLNIAGWLTTQDGFGLPGERVYWELRGRILETAGLREEQIRPVGVRVRNEFERSRQSLK